MSKAAVFPSEATVKARRARYPRGQRVELVKMEDPYAMIIAGEQGLVDHVDDTGTVFVNWESESTLGAVHGVDEIRKVSMYKHNRPVNGMDYKQGRIKPRT